MRKRFAYALDSLLKKHESEIDALRPELQQLDRVIVHRQKEIEDQNARANAAQREIVDLSRESSAIDLERRRNAQLFARHALQEAECTQAEMSRVEGLRHQVVRQLVAKRQALRAVEKHRDKRAKEHELQNLKREEAETEEIWLARFFGKKS